jgi:hypothetical protein
MIEYDRFIYLDVYRTGSSHILALLPKITDGKLLRTERHAALTKAHPLSRGSGKLVFTSVRNPWDWYVSLWAYGAEGKSAIRRYLAAHLTPAELPRLYDNEKPAVAFRNWLLTMHDPAILKRVMKEHLPQSGLAPVIGLYTYRFLRVTTLYPRFLLRWPLIRSPGDAIRHHLRFKAWSEVLRAESLDSDLIGLVERHGPACSFSADAARIIAKSAKNRRNASQRTLASYRDYYDDETAELVATRDSFFTDAFGYRF